MKAAVFDLEGTLTAGETWKGVARYLQTQGKGPEYRRFFLVHLPGALLVKARLIPKRPYQNLWMRNLARLFAGMPEAALREMGRSVVEEELWPKRKRAALAKLTELRASGHRILLASGTYQPVLAAFAERIGAEAIGTPLEVKNGVASGRLAGPMNVGRIKAKNVLVHLGWPPAFACGDTLADLPLLELAEVACVVDPEPRLRRLAEARGWTVLRGS